MSKTTTDSQAGNELAGFNFDDSEEFFGIKTDKVDSSPKIKETSKITKEKGEETTEIKEVKTDEDDIDVPEEEFFGIPSDKKPTLKKTTKAKEEVIEDEIEDDTNEESTKLKGKTKPKKEEDLDDDEEDEVIDKSKGNTKKEEEDEVTQTDDEFYGTLSFELKEKGIFQNVDLPKDKKLTEDQFFETINSEVEARVDEALEAMVADIDEDGKRFLKFKKDGGKTHEFFAHYANSLDLDELDITNDSQVNKVINYYVSTVENLEGEELDDRVKYIKEGGKAKIYAQSWFKKIRAEEDAEKDALLTAQETARKAKATQAKQFNDDITALALKTETVGDFVFSKADQKKIINTLTKGTVKVGKDRYIPEFNAKLGAILRADTKEAKENLLILAKLIDSNFNVKDLAIKKKTEATKEIKSKLRESKTGVKAHSSGGSKTRELSDFF